ncbi:hypothetical protein SAMN05428975_3274 [Mucilaginibacter sp. OK268]|nr:hypothetical protein SAMN05428975_3274 [Mucilaginibacter sp. OK268]
MLTVKSVNHVNPLFILRRLQTAQIGLLLAPSPLERAGVRLLMPQRKIDKIAG